MKTNRGSNCRTTASKTNRQSFYILALLGIIFFGVSDAGIGRSGITSGRITAFGSIFVNQREIDLDQALITVNGNAATPADLELGQVVFVRGTFDDELPVGVADDVVFDNNVAGPIGSINANEEQLSVLGQIILTDIETIYELLSGKNSFDGLSVNDQIAVSGFLTADGEILASRIAQTAPGGLHEVAGVVNTTTGNKFTINALTVDFKDAELANFPTGTIVVGDLVEAKGTAFGANGELLASEVELQTGISGAVGELGEFEGPITAFDSANSFSVGQIPVLTNSQTVFIGGGPANLADNTSVSIAGEFDADGTLVANQVTIQGTRIRLEAVVDSKSAATVTVLGITATTDSLIRIDDDSSTHLKPFGLSDLWPGDYVKLSSVRNPAATTPVIAERLTRKDPDSDIRLQGFVDLIGNYSFAMLGVTVEINQATTYFAANGEQITAAEFFAAVTAGTFVVVHGTEMPGTGVLASEVELGLDN